MAELPRLESGPTVFSLGLVLVPPASSLAEQAETSTSFSARVAAAAVMVSNLTCNRWFAVRSAENSSRDSWTRPTNTAFSTARRPIWARISSLKYSSLSSYFIGTFVAFAISAIFWLESLYSSSIFPSMAWVPDPASGESD